MPSLVSPRVSTAFQHPPSSKPADPNANYFDFPAPDAKESYNDHAKQNWSPPSSTVRSTAAVSPSVMPADQDPQLDAFRRQSLGSSKAFNLGGGLGNFQMGAPPPPNKSSDKPAVRKQSPSKNPKNASEPRDMPPPPHRKSVSDALDPSSAELGRSPKRLLSQDSTNYGDLPRRGSPASFTGGELGSHKARRDGSPDRHPRTNLPLDNNTPAGFPKHRAETLPNQQDNENPMVTPQHVVNLLETANESTLLLDLRVSTQYAQSHLTGALNLCIPTTLLKRASFNVEKLADTFKDQEQRRKFENWRKSRYIIVYDASSAQMKDATICINTIKKFQGEGYDGQLYIIKGGYAEFSRRFSSHVEDGVDSGSAASSPEGRSSSSEGNGRAPPVIGGCPMPGLTDKPANPFFGNIRQNMDLIGGVGQMQLQHPAKASKKVEQHFPTWLRAAAEEKDLGKKVSTRFEHIERREKKRMEDALSGQVSFGTPKTPGVRKAVQIAGIEKGNKNRYNNIWPFEHSRVKLQGLPTSDCDYFNASHIKAAWSNKRYISTQAPIPATFNDFWNVIWQQDARIIVMLTAEKEGPQVKAHNYWSESRYGPLKLDFLSEKRASIEPARIQRHKRRPSAARRSSTNPAVPFAPLTKDEKAGEQPYVIVRRFTLSHEGHPFERMREVTQLQYSSWPDFGAPAHPAHLLGLVEQCDAVNRSIHHTHYGEPAPPERRPMVVHCSAGCGRTGTFCTVDSVLDMLKRQRLYNKKGRERGASPMDIDEGAGSKSKAPPKMQESGGGGDFFSSQAASAPAFDGEIDGPWVQRDDQDLIEKTVEEFRHQRLSMVQSLRQYVLCYESVMEWLVEQEEGAERGQHEG